MRHFLPADCLILDRASAEPLQRQLYRLLRGLIERKILSTGSKLPSSRSLAAELGIARNTVVTVYEQLVSQGYVSVRHGARAEVVELVGAPARKAPPLPRRARLSRRGLAMHVGSGAKLGIAPPADVLDTRGFPFVAWSRAVARRALQSRSATARTGIAGEPALRAAIAEYVGVARGVYCDPQQVVVTTCTQAARDLLARMLLDPGDAVWIEEPGYLGAQDAFLTAGAHLQPLRVEGQDWRLEPPPVTPKIIYVSPANQRPLASTMRSAQRRRLLELANEFDAFIIEDDFDGDYSFGSHPVPTLHSTDTSDRVIYLGNFDRLLFPATRMGFVVLPQGLVDAFQHSLNITGQSPPQVLQAALADFIDEGHMTLHLKKMRAIYARRRMLLRDLTATRLSRWLSLTPGDVGFSCVGLMSGSLNDFHLAEALAGDGLCVSPLSMHYRLGKSRPGLVMSFGPLTEADTPRAVELIERAFRRAVGPAD